MDPLDLSWSLNHLLVKSYFPNKSVVNKTYHLAKADTRVVKQLPSRREANLFRDPRGKLRLFFIIFIEKREKT